MQHLDEGTIHAWLDGALTAEEAGGVERHARECAECAALVADARGMIAGAARIVSALDDVPAGVIPSRPAPPTSGSLWRALHLTPLRAALAASLMVAAASLTVVRHAPPRGEKAKADTASVARAATTVENLPFSPKAAAPAANTGLSVKAAPTARVAASATPPAAASSASVATDSVATEKKVAVGGFAQERRALAAPVTDSARAAPSMVAASPPPAPTVEPRARAGQAGASADVSAPKRAGALESAVAVGAKATSFVAASADERPLTLPGCYQLVRDSVHAAFELPERVSFERATDAASSGNVMRAVTEDGRRDTLLTRITWRLAPGATRVLISNEGSPSFAMSLRQQTTNGGGRVARELAGIAPVRLSRIECR